MEDEYYKEARSIVKRKKGFYSHFAIWIVSTIFFLILNNLTSPFETWWVFPALGWGLGVAIHFISVFGFASSKSWEKKAIQKEMDKLHKSDSKRNDYGELDLDKIPNREKYAADKFEELRKDWDDKEFV